MWNRISETNKVILNGFALWIAFGVIGYLLKTIVHFFFGLLWAIIDCAIIALSIGFEKDNYTTHLPTENEAFLTYMIFMAIVVVIIFYDDYINESKKSDRKSAEKRKIKKQKQLTKAMMKVDYSGALRHLSISDHGKFKTFFTKIHNRVIKNEKYNSLTAEQAFDYMKKVVWQWCKERGYSDEVIQNILIDTKIIDK